MGHYLSRVRAYDDVFTEFGYFNKEAAMKAEMKHYKTMFDENGLIKDKALKYMTGEIALNIDDNISNFLNKATTAVPILKEQILFPRTQSNAMKLALSYTPFAALPIHKYGKVIWAKSDDQIAKALKDHGIDMATTPNARIIFENLKADYIGRMAFSGLLVGTLYQYAMGGNIRGNGHHNTSRRVKERDELGYIPRTINIGGKWVSYQGIPGVEGILALIGDFAYYSSDLDQALVEEWEAKLIWSIGATFFGATPLQGLEPLLAGINGNVNAWNRLLANSARSFLPLSGGAGVTAKAISPALKDIESDWTSYIKNRLPGFNHNLPKRIDVWTGKPVNDIDNPVLKGLNAVNKLSISGDNEPWRQWLYESGWDGISLIKRHSEGYAYTADEREEIHTFIGEQEPYKKLEALMKSKKYENEMNLIRQHRRSGDNIDEDDIKLRTKLLPLHQRISDILKEAQQKAEIKLATLAREQPEKYGHIKKFNENQKMANEAMKEGDIKRAQELQKDYQKTRELIQYGNN